MLARWLYMGAPKCASCHRTVMVITGRACSVKVMYTHTVCNLWLSLLLLFYCWFCVCVCVWGGGVCVGLCGCVCLGVISELLLFVETRCPIFSLLH